MRGNTLRTSTVQAGTKPNLNEAFFVKREMAADHPDVLANRRFRGRNRWPDGLPWLPPTAVDYCNTMEAAGAEDGAPLRPCARLAGRAYFDGPFPRLPVFAAHDALPAPGRSDRR